MLRVSRERLNPVRTYIFSFSQTTGFWGKVLPGFTHVDLLEVISSTTLVFAPTWSGAEIFTRDTPTSIPGHTNVLVKVLRTKEQRLVKPIIQTCANLVQYVAYLSLGAITCQALYKKLTQQDAGWLRSKGIRHTEVLSEDTPWELQKLV